VSSGPRDLFPVVRVSDLEDPSPDRQWLIESIWARAGVGIISGVPKSKKSWLGLEFVLSVASHTPFLGAFHVHDPGPALLYMAEDTHPNIKDRVSNLCRHRGLHLSGLPIDVITVPSLRLDLTADQDRLKNTLEHLRPRLLFLDPFVRLHSINENDAREVAALLGFLRGLQRAFDLAVVLVHHARKNSRPGPAGLNIRGSIDFYAWYDSSLHVHRNHDDILRLTSEHRSAPAPPSFCVRLHAPDDPDHTDPIHFQFLDPPPETPAIGQPDLDAAILAALQTEPLTRDQLRAILRIRNQRLGVALDRLARERRIRRVAGRWSVPVPAPSVSPERNDPSRPLPQLSILDS
jgi:hypothetical protein